MGSNFISNNRDHKFILKEWLDLDKLVNCERFRNHFDLSDVDMLLDQAIKIAENIVAPTYDETEANPLRLVNGKVKVTPAFRSAFQFLNENGWGLSDGDKDAEDKLPGVVFTACDEFLTGANPNLTQLMIISKCAARLIQTYGDKQVKDTYLPNMFSGKWSGAMCMTETGAGTDVGDLSTKARPTDNPKVYKIKGTKCFISVGEHDVTGNIVCALLARVDGAAQGTQGISLFVVPKYWVNEDGSLEWNDVTTIALEHKMGWKGSPTCILNFGEDDNCRGYILGEAPDQSGKGKGMAQMFQAVNEARMSTGHIALAISNVAYHNAVQYAKQRIQGRSFTSGNAGSRVRIIEHEDVRRMLMLQKATLEAIRALVLKTYYYYDLVDYSCDKADIGRARRRAEVNTPLVKAYCSDMAWQLTAEAIQVFGGYGYSEEYPVAHSARDAKILSIWDGTNYIQAKDLVERKWNMDKGAVFQEWLQDIEDFITMHETNEDFSKEFTILKNAFNAYREMKAFIMGSMDDNPGLCPLYATRILHSTAIMYCGKLLLSQGLLAKKKLAVLKPNDYDYNFYQGKTESVKYYLRNIVPSVILTKDIVLTADTSALDIPAEAL